jgi:hypothetical protein
VKIPIGKFDDFGISGTLSACGALNSVGVAVMRACLLISRRASSSAAVGVRFASETIICVAARWRIVFSDYEASGHFSYHRANSIRRRQQTW